MDFRDPVNLVTAAVALIVGAGNYTLQLGRLPFAGIALGTLAAIVIYQVLRAFAPEVEPRGAEEGGAFGDPLAGPLGALAGPARDVGRVRPGRPPRPHLSRSGLQDVGVAGERIAAIAPRLDAAG